jgi:hypothetical protein
MTYFLWARKQGWLSVELEWSFDIWARTRWRDLVSSNRSHYSLSEDLLSIDTDETESLSADGTDYFSSEHVLAIGDEETEPV